MVAKHFAEYLGEVQVTAAGHAVVDLLQGDDVGFFGFADPCNALGIKFAVVTDCLVDVVCEDGDQQKRNLLQGQG